jgi:hypothetical protein
MMILCPKSVLFAYSAIAGGDGPPLQPPLCLAGRAAEGRERAARRADRPASLPATRLPKQRAAGRGPRRRICARKRQGAHYGRASREQNGARKGTRAHLRAAELRRPRPACLSAGWGYPRGCSAAPSHRFPRRCLPFSPFQPQRAASSSKQPLSSCYHLFRFPRQAQTAPTSSVARSMPIGAGRRQRRRARALARHASAGYATA